MSLRVDHFSIAVASMNQALDFFSRYLPVTMNHESAQGYDDQFRWCDFYVGDTKIELIESARPGSFVETFLERRGEGIHHLSLEVDDLEAVIGPMEKDGLRIVDRFDTGDGHHTAFVSPRSAMGMLIQFWQVGHDLDAVTLPPPIAPMPFGDVRMRFDHISTAVRDLDRASDFFTRYFPVQARGERHLGYAGDFELMQFTINGFAVELIAETDAPSFLTRFLSKRGEGFHHISIDVDALDPVVEKLRADGVRVVDEADIGNGYKTAFVSPRSAHGVLVQFWQVPDLEEPLSLG